MSTFTTVLTSTSLLIALVSASPTANAQCAPLLDTQRTHFPTRAVEKQQSGVVRLGIRIDAQGAVVAARVVATSGHATLDSSAMSDVRAHWRFQIGQCSATELAAEREVLVNYRRPAGTTVSGTRNRKALAHIRELQADQSCHATRGSHDVTVFACREATKDRLAEAMR